MEVLPPGLIITRNAPPEDIGIERVPQTLSVLDALGVGAAAKKDALLIERLLMMDAVIPGGVAVDIAPGGDRVEPAAVEPELPRRRARRAWLTFEDALQLIVERLHRTGVHVVEPFPKQAALSVGERRVDPVDDVDFLARTREIEAVRALEAFVVDLPDDPLLRHDLGQDRVHAAVPLLGSARRQRTGCPHERL